MERSVRGGRMVAMLVTVAALAASGRAAPAAGWKAGVAREAITPTRPTWMAGYASRDKPSEGAVHDLWAKALVLEDPEGRKAALVTLDLCGIGRELSNGIRDAIGAKLGAGRDRVVLSCSHTHCGPVVGSNLITMYRIDDAQRRVVAEYAEGLAGAIVATVARAAEKLEAAEMAWGEGRADFAVNRRENKEAEVPALRDRLALKGPVDHDVPVLRVLSPGGQVLAVVFSYSCHCTTLSFNKFCGDYAGFAQVALESALPGTQAMFVAGCGADQNPLPRRTVELAEAYGNQLAGAVREVLGRPLHPISGPLTSAYEEIELAFSELPTREKLEAEARSPDLSLANRAKLLLQTIESRGRLATTYPYPVEAWRLGDLTWIFLGGEVVVDYSLRIKRNLGGSRIWVSSYCNDVMAYIPSLRVLKEGGYEGERSMIPYGLPAPWAEKVEEDIIAAVLRVDQRTRPRK
jgi:Neutral/alkaline non-lysosomal ceramidase, N-terminal